MKIIKTYNNIELIVVDIPEDVYDFYYDSWFTRYINHSKGSIKLDINTKILGKLSELSEEECKKYVEGFFKHDLSENFDCWKNYYNPKFITYSKATAKESLISLLQSEGVDTNNPNKILLLKKIN